MYLKQGYNILLICDFLFIPIIIYIIVSICFSISSILSLCHSLSYYVLLFTVSLLWYVSFAFVHDVCNKQGVQYSRRFESFSPVMHLFYSILYININVSE
jgi:hypothetical protein